MALIAVSSFQHGIRGGVLMDVFLGLIHSTEILTIGYNGYINGK
jgi:hypothetical protein